MSQKTLRPLRVILHVYRHRVTGRLIEVLSCGHHQPEREDAFGPVPASRRRCRRCRLRHRDCEATAPAPDP